LERKFTNFPFAACIKRKQFAMAVVQGLSCVKDAKHIKLRSPKVKASDTHTHIHTYTATMSVRQTITPTQTSYTPQAKNEHHATATTCYNQVASHS